MVTTAITRVAIGATVVNEPLDLTGAMATYLISDPLEVGGFRKVQASITPGQPNQWQAAIDPDVEAQLLYSFPDDPIVHHSALPQRSQRLLYSYLGTVTREDVPLDASFTFNIALDRAYAAADALSWYSLGAWTARAFVPGELPAVGAVRFQPPLEFPFTSSTSLGGRPHQRLQATDAMLFLRYNAGKLSGYAAAPPFQMSGGPNPITGTLTAVAQTESLAASFDTTTTTARLANVRPANPTVQPVWFIVAAPAGSLGFTGGPTLASAGIAPNTGVVPVVASYGNPFGDRGWTPTLIWRVLASRVYQPAGMPAIALSSAFITTQPVPTDNSPLGAPSCLPTSVVVQGATLLTDGLTVTLDRTKPVAVSFIADNTDADAYVISLLEIVVNGTVASLQTRFESISNKTTWSLPADLFVAGKTYVVRAECSRGGIPGITLGDLVGREATRHSGYMDSGAFTVAQ